MTNFGFLHWLIVLSSFYIGPLVANLAFVDLIRPAADRAVLPYVPLMNLLNVLFLSLENISLKPFLTCGMVMGFIIGGAHVLAAIQADAEATKDRQAKRERDAEYARQQEAKRRRQAEQGWEAEHPRAHDERQREAERERQKERDQAAKRQSEKTEWWKILQVSPDADLDMIRDSYHRLVKQYHPDVVSRLGPEFAELAEARTKALNAAYERAKRERTATS